MSYIASTYARAFKGHFGPRETESFFSCVKELNQLNTALNQLEIKSFFISPAISIERKKQVLKQLFRTLKFNDLVCSFLFLLLDRKRWRSLSAIVKCLLDMERKRKGVVYVEVQAARKLPSGLKERLAETLEKGFGKEVSLEEKRSSAELMGGVKVRSEGLVLDDTLLFHLTQMENQIRRCFYDYTGK
jgi:F-type H+-transporting ATPase subunit delta